MESSIPILCLYDNNVIHISFKNNIYKNIKNLYFIPNKNINYYDNSHLNYIYKIKANDLLITFHAFYKDEYLIIVFDSYNEILDTKIEHKQVIYIKINWISIKINENKSVWIIDIEEFKNISLISYILPIRQNIFSEHFLKLNDFIKIYEYEINNVNIKISENNINNNTNNTNNNINNSINNIKNNLLKYIT
jgi:hypothetical protein